jgi:hypothetical protein
MPNRLNATPADHSPSLVPDFLDLLGVLWMCPKASFLSLPDAGGVVLSMFSEWRVAESSRMESPRCLDLPDLDLRRRCSLQ